MGKKTRHIHLLVDNRQFESLKLESRNSHTAINETIRRKLSLPQTPQEVLLLRKLKSILNKK